MKPHRVCWLACLTGMLWTGPSLAQWGGPTKVRVGQVEMRSLPDSMTLVGTVSPVTSSVIGTEVAGLVADMPVRQGDFVRQGELLCKLKDDTAVLQLAEAREQLKSLEAAHRKWIYELERIQRLYGGQDASEKEVYETQAQHDQTMHAAGRQQALVQRLENELAKTEIRAPFSGYVVRRATEVGQWLKLGGDVVEMADLSTVLVQVDIPEKALPFVQVGDAATIRVDAVDGRFAGNVRHVMLQADPTARTFPVEIAMENPCYVSVDGQKLPRTLIEGARDAVPISTEVDHSDRSERNRSDESGRPVHPTLAAGMFARVTLRAGPTRAVAAVPKDAVVSRGGTEYVAVVRPGREEGQLMAMPMAVTTGVDIDDWIAITSGNLRAGVRVVTWGNENILFPSPIRILGGDEALEATASAGAGGAGPRTGS